MRNIFLSFVIAMLVITPAYAKRAAPPQVAPIEKDGHIYSVKFYSGPKGYDVYIECTDTKTKDLVWKNRIFGDKIDPKREADIQYVYPTSMSLNGQLLLTTDEKGRTHKINSVTGELITE